MLLFDTKVTHQLSPKEYFQILQECGYDFHVTGKSNQFNQFVCVNQDTNEYGWRFVTNPTKRTPYINASYVLKRQKSGEEYYRAGSTRRTNSHEIWLDIDAHPQRSQTILEAQEEARRSLTIVLTLFDVNKPLALEIGLSGGFHCILRCKDSVDDYFLHLLKKYFKEKLNLNNIEVIYANNALAYINGQNYYPIKGITFSDGGIGNIESYIHAYEFYDDIINYNAKYSDQLISIGKISKKIGLDYESIYIRLKKALSSEVNDTYSGIECRRYFTIADKAVNNLYHDTIHLPFCDAKYDGVEFGKGTRHSILIGEGEGLSLGRHAFNEMLHGYFGGNISGVDQEQFYNQWSRYISKYEDSDNPSCDWDKTKRNIFDSLFNTYDPKKDALVLGAIKHICAHDVAYIDHTELLSEELKEVIPHISKMIFRKLTTGTQFQRAREKREADLMKAIIVLMENYLSTVIYFVTLRKTCSIPLVMPRSYIYDIKKKHGIQNSMRDLSIRVLHYLVEELGLFVTKIGHQNFQGMKRKSRYIIKPRNCRNIRDYLLKKMIDHIMNNENTRGVEWNYDRNLARL
jgi:hypothetical protein